MHLYDSYFIILLKITIEVLTLNAMMYKNNIWNAFLQNAQERILILIAVVSLIHNNGRTLRR